MEVLNWYNHPECYDLSFAPETKVEVELFGLAVELFAKREVASVLEPACGSGRLLSRLAFRGYECYGFDLSPNALDFAARRFKRRGLSAELWADDMAAFKLKRKVDAALCTINTFRHLLTERQARGHLEKMARAVKKGGIYMLGLGLIPEGGASYSEIEWVVRQGKTVQANRLEVLDINTRSRKERLKITISKKSRSGTLNLFSEYDLRTYKLGQLKRLLGAVPEFELVGVFDHAFELIDPSELNASHEDVSLVLRRK